MNKRATFYTIQRNEANNNMTIVLRKFVDDFITLIATLTEK